MFILPALVLPLVLGLAIVRLYRIPRQLWSGALVLPGRRRIVLHAATITAYAVLLVYTLALGVALMQALLFAEGRLSAYLALLAYVAAYPLVYMGAAWVFYHGLKPPPAPRR